MQCLDGATFQCSGATLLRTENGIALSDSGVQVYGVSTSDLEVVNPNMTGATGYRPATGGSAEIRLDKDASGNVGSMYLILRNLGLSWDGVRERPAIIEVFNPAQGRSGLDANGRVVFSSLPDSADLDFYDFVTLGPNGNQSNYANNRYFPRTDNPARCPPDIDPCPQTETGGVGSAAGSWRSGGDIPDWASAGRLHGDGDVHAGNGNPVGSVPTWLPGGTGIGVPFPGSKGYRSLANWGYRYANLSTWTTQDTVLIEEWAGLGNEHNKNRRGAIAFGDVTTPASVPSTGMASYQGIAYGWYTPDGQAEPRMYWGDATVNANFAAGQVTVAIANTSTYDAQSDSVPAELNATATMGAAQERNYMTGAAATGAMNGGVSARWFGPVDGSAPPEIAGTFTLTNAGSGEAIIGGFIARRP